MKHEYEDKRLKYNLELTDLKKYKENYEKKLVDIKKNEYEETIRKKNKKIEMLKKEMNLFFDENKIEISNEMLSDYSLIDKDYNYYKDEIVVEDNKNYNMKKSKEEIEKEFENVLEKIERKYKNNSITKIIYDDLIRCFDIYKLNILNNYDSVDEKRYLSSNDLNNIKKSKKNKKVSTFYGLIIPLTVLDLIFIIYLIIVSGQCIILDSEQLSNILCSLTIMGILFTRFVTIGLVIYYIVFFAKNGKNIKKIKIKNKVRK